MTLPCVLIAGCGDLGTRLGERLAQQGWLVYGLRRHTEGLSSCIQPISADLSQAALPASWPQHPIDYVVYAAAADQSDEVSYRRAYLEGLQHLLNWLKPQAVRRLIFVSSTSVYAQHQGEWVDETSLTQPERFSGRILLEAERLALQSGHPATAVRLAGLYGPKRTWLIRQVQQGYQVASEPPQYSNRIHIDDAAGLLAFLLDRDQKGLVVADCYLGTDDDPAPLDQVIRWLAQQLSIPEGAATGSRSLGSKRCSNARARAQGWVPFYPSYQQGYQDVISG